jgi:periplasmic divalent cation tolerance protein
MFSFATVSTEGTPFSLKVQLINIVNDDKILIVLTTMPDDERADALATTLVDQRLAACVNVHPPMRSVYRWKGAIEHDGERQVVIKTTAARLADLEARVRALHPYELPEWIVIEASAGEAYRAWIIESAAGGAGTR